MNLFQLRKQVALQYTGSAYSFKMSLVDIEILSKISYAEFYFV